MTNAELADLLTTRPWDIKVSMSKAGIYLTIDGVPHVIDETQACIIWDLMPTIAALKRPDSSLTQQEKA